MSATPLIVTDDEVVAAAFLSGADVPAPMETVALENRAEVEAAIARGIRLLRLRGILEQDADGGNNEWRLLHSLVTTPVRMVLAETDAEFFAIRGSERFEFRGTDDQWVAVHTELAGIHHVTRCTRDDAIDFAGSMLEARKGTSESTDLCALVKGRQGELAGALQASDGRLTALAFDGGRGLVPTHGESGDSSPGAASRSLSSLLGDD